MGKKKGPRPAGPAKRGGPWRGPKGGEELDEEMYDEVDQHHRATQKRQEDYIGLDGGQGSEEDDDEEEEEEGVFDLNLGGSGGSSDSDEELSEEEEEGESEEGGDDDDDDDDEEEDGGGRRRPRGVERPGLLSDEEKGDSEEEEEETARRVRQWGRSKQQYYNADATDLEIGQDFEDAEEEERAAREVERARYEDMGEGDYGAFDVEEETLGGRLKGKGKDKGKKEKKAQANGGVGPLAAALLSAGRGVETATVARDLSRLGKSGKLQVLVTDAPELLTLLEEFREKLGELRERVEPLLPLVRQGGPAAGRVTEEGVAYLEVKQQLLLNYCINLTYYLLLKAEGKPVRDHPVMVQLLELRAAFEKLRPLDAKLKFHIDRLLRVAEMSREALAGGQGKGAAGRDPLSFRPNPDALLGKGGGAGEEEEGESEGEGDGGAAGGVYRPPRLAAVPYEEDGGKGKGKGKDGEQLRKSLEKLRRSEILQTLTEQFSERPEMVSEGASAGALERRRREEEEARRAYEEERFVRLVTSKKEKKLRKAAERESGRLETIADVGDFHELEASLAALGDAGAAARAAAGKLRKASSSKASTDVAGASALQRAVNSLAQKERSTKRRREREMTGDADVPYRNPDEIRVSASVRRPAPEEGDMGMDAADAAALAALSGGGVGGRRAGKKGRVAVDMEEVGAREPVEEDAYYEAVAGKRRAKRAEKEGLYAVEPTYGAREDELGDGEKRGINYQILKNRGLTAYKAKLNRNPRVKKREAFRKATIRRKGQVREVRASEAAGYGGEATGINARVVRVRGKK